jgi:hypothetical protein
LGHCRGPGGRIFGAVGSWTCCSVVIRDGAAVRASLA